MRTWAIATSKPNFFNPVPAAESIPDIRRQGTEPVWFFLSVSQSAERKISPCSWYRAESDVR